MNSNDGVYPKLAALELEKIASVLQLSFKLLKESHTLHSVGRLKLLYHWFMKNNQEEESHSKALTLSLYVCFYARIASAH